MTYKDMKMTPTEARDICSWISFAAAQLDPEKERAANDMKQNFIRTGKISKRLLFDHWKLIAAQILIEDVRKDLEKSIREQSRNAGEVIG